MSDLSVERRLACAVHAVDEAGVVAMRHFRSGVAVELKPDRSPVTAADREAEERIREIVLAEFPDDGFLGEEGAAREGKSGYRWVVDPIDGTHAFVQGVPLFGVLVGLEDPSGTPVAGTIALPAIGERIAAARGLGCRWNGRPARVSDVSRLSESCLVHTDLAGFEQTGRREAFERVRAAVRLCRGWGDCYGHVLVATGRAEVMLDPVVAHWDCAALLPILEEAGGVFTDWSGRRTASGGSAISTNGAVRSELEALLRE